MHSLMLCVTCDSYFSTMNSTTSPLPSSSATVSVVDDPVISSSTFGSFSSTVQESRVSPVDLIQATHAHPESTSVSIVEASVPPQPSSRPLRAEAADFNSMLTHHTPESVSISVSQALASYVMDPTKVVKAAIPDQSSNVCKVKPQLQMSSSTDSPTMMNMALPNIPSPPTQQVIITPAAQASSTPQYNPFPMVSSQLLGQENRVSSETKKKNTVKLVPKDHPRDQ